MGLMGMDLLGLVSCGVAFDVKNLTFFYQIKKTKIYTCVCVCVCFDGVVEMNGILSEISVVKWNGVFCDNGYRLTGGDLAPPSGSFIIFVARG